MIFIDLFNLHIFFIRKQRDNVTTLEEEEELRLDKNFSQDDDVDIFHAKTIVKNITQTASKEIVNPEKRKQDTVLGGVSFFF